MVNQDDWYRVYDDGYYDAQDGYVNANLYDPEKEPELWNAYEVGYEDGSK